MNKINHFYHNIYGWFTFPNLYLNMVRELPTNAVVVEVGVFLGKSLAFLGVECLNSNKNISIYGIDHWNGSLEHHDCNEYKLSTLWDQFCYNINPIINNINIIRKNSIDASKDFADNSIDFLFLDASHDYESVLHDLEAWYPKIKVGGYFGGHDYPAYPGVVKAVNEFFSNRTDQSFDYIYEGCFLFKKIN